MPSQQEIDQEFDGSEIERRVAELERKVNEYEQGGFDLFRQFGYLQLGVNLPRLDKYGMQVQSSGTSQNAITFVPKFVVDPTVEENRAELQGNVDASGSQIYEGAFAVANNLEKFAGVYAIAFDGTTGATQTKFYVQNWDGNNTTAEAGYFFSSTQDLAFKIQVAPLWLEGSTSDPANLRDGMFWYRTDTDKHYLRQNGATVELGGGGGSMPMPPLVGTASWHCVGTQLAAWASAAPVSAAWPAANRAYYIPLTVTEDITVTKLWVHNGGVSGNVDMGIYSSAFSRLVSIGSTANAGLNVIQEFDIADTALSAGLYYIGIAFDNTTAAPFRFAATAVSAQQWGVAEEASAFTLPATATPADLSSTYLPICGIATRTQVA